ncbi:MAG: PAS domain S-box protein [Candidatus Scalindua sp.]|nr:PAS domain S-box protein [Candidatus Scalindua sp.]
MNNVAVQAQITMEIKASILVVDDNERLCDSIRDVLEENGYAVDTIRNGKDAINLSQNNIYDIALVDLILPDTQGTELVNSLASLSPSLEFILITAHATLNSAVEAVHHDRVISYELKPLDMDRLLSILNQIVKRRKAEEEVRRLTQAVEQSSSIVLITDAEGKIEYSNSKFSQLTGYSSEEVFGQNPRLLKSGKTFPEVYRELWQTVKSGSEWRGEFCNVKKGGETYWESATISPVKNDSDIITHFIAIKEDISERKKAEKCAQTEHIVTALLEEPIAIKEVFFKILQSLCVTLEWDYGEIWTLDQQDYLLRCAGSWHIPSVDLHEFEEVSKDIAFSPGDGLPGRILSNAKPVWITDIVRDSDFLRAKIAERVGLHGAFGFPIFSGHEVLGAIALYNRKIAQVDKCLVDMMSSVGRQIGLFIKRKQADIELERSETKYRKLIETAQNAVICIDENGMINLWNQSAEGIFGYSKAEIMGESIETIIPNENKKRYQEGFKQLVGTGESTFMGKPMEILGISKEKKLIPLEMFLTFQKIENEKYLYTAIIQDLTERKKTEEMLLHTEKLKSMGVMASGVAHDFNNLLAIISGNTQLLEMRYEGDKELTDTLHIINRAIKDGAGIVSRMLKSTKIERDITGFVPVDIKDVLVHAIDFIRPRWMNMARAAGIMYDMDMGNIKAVPTIMGNPSELREVFINIINNALDVMSSGGRLSFCSWTENQTVLVSIADSGDGMSEEVRKRIFDPFFTTKRAKGSGLGMSVAYGIITGHGGNIILESEKGKGTTFTLTFPVSGEVVPQTELPEPKQVIVRKLHLLIVDDEEDICNILEDFFSVDGHDVEYVTSGREAIKLLNDVKYELVLTDLVMPDSSGYDVVKKVNGLKEKPIIGIITGWGEELKPMNDDNYKADFVINKPFDFEELTRQINEAISVE